MCGEILGLWPRKMGIGELFWSWCIGRRLAGMAMPDVRVHCSASGVQRAWLPEQIPRLCSKVLILVEVIELGNDAAKCECLPPSLDMSPDSTISMITSS